MEKEVDIVCTIGPSSINSLEALTSAGMTVARLNLSHTTSESLSKAINSIIESSKSSKFKVALDTAGPEIRMISTVGSKMKESNSYNIFFKNTFTNNCIYCTLDSSSRIAANHPVLFCDGKFKGTITEVTPLYFTVRMDSDLPINSKNIKMRIPGVTFKTIFTKTDKSLIHEAAKLHKIDYLFVSFTNCAKDIKEVNKFLKGVPNCTPKIIAKIETRHGVENVQEIAQCCDGIMIARGDLMLDVGVENLFSSQMRIIKATKETYCILATQVIESMTYNPSPTRAEISDVGYAVINGVNGIMTSGETAIGKYPVESVKTISKIIRDAMRIKKTLL